MDLAFLLTPVSASTLLSTLLAPCCSSACSWKIGKPWRLARPRGLWNGGWSFVWVWECSCKAPAAARDMQWIYDVLFLWGSASATLTRLLSCYRFGRRMLTAERHMGKPCLTTWLWTLHDTQLAKQQTNGKRDMG